MQRIREDVPIARRVSRGAKSRELPIGPVVLSVALALGTGLAALFLLQDQISQGFLAPSLVAGIDVKPDQFGRLLGHFPYPQASGDQLVEIAPGMFLQADAAGAYEQMRLAAETDGVELRLISAYRSISTQKQIFFDVKSERNQSAEARAKVSAPPGYSEHSTGYAIDIGDGSLPQSNLSVDFETTPAFYWLQNNSQRYHFQLSFPLGNRQGVSYEPWHWRFEGSSDALKRFQPANQHEQRGV